MSIEPSQGFAYLCQFLLWRNDPEGAFVKAVAGNNHSTSEDDLRTAFLAAGIVNANTGAVLGVLAEGSGEWKPVGKPFEFGNDASFAVADVQVDGLVASLRLQSDLLRIQGRGTSPGELAVVLRQKGVQFGVDQDVLARIAADLPVGWFEVARGKVPVDGTDSSVECLVHLDDLVLPSPSDDGSVDFRDRGRLPEIGVGTAIYVRHPGVEAVDGTDLAGRTIPAKRGKDVKLAPTPGSRFRADDPNVVEAAFDGYLFRGRDGRIHVGEQFQVKGDLDLSVGNIKYHGTVEIGGNVPAGFQILAGGNVTIQGTAESATIVSNNGSIQVRGGVFGGDLKAAADIRVAFAHDATMECGGLLEAGKYLQHCKVRCATLKFKQGGILVGGDTFAFKEIDVETMGTSAGTPTRVRMAVPEEEDARMELEKMAGDEKKLKLLRDILEPKVMTIRQRLGSGGQLLGKAREDAEETLRQYSGMMERTRAMEKRRQECLEILAAEHERDGSIVVRKEIFPGTEMHIFGKHVPIEQLRLPVRLSVKDDEIETRRV